MRKHNATAVKLVCLISVDLINENYDENLLVDNLFSTT